jgi:hypothetical protein
MKLKHIIIGIVFILMVNVVLAADLRPEIKVPFNEVVNEDTIQINLTNQSGNIFPLEQVSSDNPIFVYRPVNDIPEGFYTVRARAEDIEGTLGPVLEVGFLVWIPPVDIILINPSFGVSPNATFDLIIETDKTAVCKYSKVSYGSMASTFDRVEGNRHIIDGYDSGGDLYVGCTDEDEKITNKKFVLSIDEVPPALSLAANEVTEFTDVGEFSTTLIATVDKDSVCKYYKEGGQSDYKDMLEFPDYNETLVYSYKTRHEQLLTQDILIDEEINKFYGMCMGKSGKLSTLAQIDINVDTSKAPEFNIHNPKRYIQDTTPLFEVRSNRASNCELYKSSSLVDSNSIGEMSGRGTMTHALTLSSPLAIGTYTYYIKCTFDVESPPPKSVTFTIDHTPPNMTYVDMMSPIENVTDKTYDDDELCAEWEGEDGESSISLYTYSIYWDKSSDELIKSGTKSPAGDDEYCVNVDLNDSQRYYFEVSAQNGVGLWSENKTSSSILVDVSLAPARCNNNRKDGVETDKDCGGPTCDGCGNGQDCLLNRDCDNNYCNSSNKCATPRCDDGVGNGEETDVDCGGGCKDCDIGKFCDKDSDCKTDNCDSSTGKCTSVSDTCENNKLDLDETDIDCGGDCPGCGVGENCDSDSDCTPAAECKSLICELRPVDTDGDGINDDVDNCPNDANFDQADVDSDGEGDVCDLDSDNDGLPDSFEQNYFDCVTCANPDDDPDKDGLSNLDEYTYNTNPTKKDTDGDGYSDKEEIDNGSDPLDPGSKPIGNFWKYFFLFFLLVILGAGGYYGYKWFKEKKNPFVKKPSMAKRPPIRRMPPGKLPMRRMPLRRPPLVRKGMPRIRLLPRKIIPVKKAIKPVRVKKIIPVKKEVKKVIVKPVEKKEGDVFKRLSNIAKTERAGQVKKSMKALNLTDKELKEKISKLKKEIKAR